MPFPSGPRSGKHGVVKAANATSGVTGVVSAVRNWSVNHNQTPEDHVHSGTLGGHERGNGYFDWNGSFEGFGAYPGIFPGDLFEFTGFAGPDNGVFGTSGNAVIGNAIMDSLTINWNFQPGGSLSWSGSFSANGCLDEDNVADITGVYTPCPYRMCNLVLKYKEACAGVLTNFAAVQSASLTFTSANIPFNNSDTLCCTYRRPGNLDWTLGVVTQDNYSPFVNGAFYEFNLFTNATEFWGMQWGLFTGIDNFNVNIETGEIITKQFNFAMKGFHCCTPGSLEIGEIVTPALGGDARIVWPLAPAA